MKINKKLLIKILFICAFVEFGAILLVISDPYINKPRTTGVKVSTVKPTAKPESVTRMYFEDEENLPTEPEANTEYTFEFTIQNADNKYKYVPYEIYLDLEGYILPVSKGSVSLYQDESQTVTGSYSIPLPVREGKVVIKLKNEDKFIEFPIRG